MVLREIKEEWILLAFSSPDLKIDYIKNPEIVYYFKKIFEANNKILRLVLKKLPPKDEYLIITCYFDRNMRNSL
jgi:hypothetical protein